MRKINVIFCLVFSQDLAADEEFVYGVGDNLAAAR